jgi:hypothetical protein
MEGNAATAAVVPLLTWVNRFPEKLLDKEGPRRSIVSRGKKKADCRG